jgi:hypothetical protein
MCDKDLLDQALSLMQEALQLLDEAKAAPHVGANLDFAICQLQGKTAARANPRASNVRTTHP